MVVNNRIQRSLVSGELYIQDMKGKTKTSPNSVFAVRGVHPERSRRAQPNAFGNFANTQNVI